LLVNLLSNAAKYTRAGGHIELKVRIENDEAVVSITDNGVGTRRCRGGYAP
jgi:two-component system sensor histidine kinase BaeS